MFGQRRDGSYCFVASETYKNGIRFKSLLYLVDSQCFMYWGVMHRTTADNFISETYPRTVLPEE